MTDLRKHSRTITEGPHEYRWTVESGTWPDGDLLLKTVKVVYQVQGREYEVTISTLMEATTL